MASSNKLALTFMEASQAQKHVTFNDALVALDAIVMLSVKGLFTNTPPGSPAAGDRYITGGAPTGAWAGQAGKLTAWQDGAWRFYSPQIGWVCFVENDGVYYLDQGFTWTKLLGGSALQNLTRLGVNATADATNQISANIPQALFNNAGAGINLVLNKNAVGNDASLQFQTAFATKFLFGLLASDDFSFKVTPDGSNFFTPERAHRLLHGRLSTKPANRLIQAEWTPRPGLATLDTTGLGSVVTGTLGAVSPSASNLFTQSPRVKVTSAAVAGSAAAVNGGGAPHLWRGNAADMGGFYVRMVAGIETFQATSRMFMGLYNTVTAIGNVNPSTLLNMVGVGFDSGDTTLQLMTNDGTGAATKTNLGAGFPTTGGQDLYELILSAQPNGSEIRYRVERLNGGNVAEGAITTDMPVNTVFMTPHFWYNNGTSAGSTELAIHDMYCENASMSGSRNNIG